MVVDFKIPFALPEMPEIVPSGVVEFVIKQRYWRMPFISYAARSVGAPRDFY
ncbi:MAG: hypothetical protein HFE29_02125 [Clostridia bacterium]|nr:hypothetical protein [Clostridia bacterium]